MEYNIDHETRIKTAVREYANTNSTLIRQKHLMNIESFEHIVNIGTSIMMNTWEINTFPGSFVKSILKNDLSAAVRSSDHINADTLCFYVTLRANLRYVE